MKNEKNKPLLNLWNHFLGGSCQQNLDCGDLRESYLKKSFRQNNLPSLEKHLSVRVVLQSEHCTHFACHALSKTFSRKRSRMGLSHAAHCTIALGPPTASVKPMWRRSAKYSQLKSVKFIELITQQVYIK